MFKKLSLKEIRLLIIHRALSDESKPPSSMSAIVQGMQEMCKDFHKIEFSHVRRQGNKAAHLLAKHTIGISDFIAWIEETSYFIKQTLIYDVTNFFDL